MFELAFILLPITTLWNKVESPVVLLGYYCAFDTFLGRTYLSRSYCRT
jgi:hypothetical protein